VSENDQLYKQCYKTLNLNPGCGWDQLRSAYKTQIQRWHPDKFEDGSAKKDAAQEKIKDLNKAYQYLSKFYKKNGFLPEIEPETEQEKPATVKSQSTPATEAASSRPQTKPVSETKTKTASSTSQVNARPIKNAIIASIIVISLVYYALSHLTDNHDRNIEKSSVRSPDIHQYNKSSTEAVENDSLNKDIAEEKKKTKARKNNKEFTYGSSIGEVIMIQGEPTKIEDNVWYYGDSKVYFHNGIVQSWERSMGSPLKAGLGLKTLEKEEE